MKVDVIRHLPEGADREINQAGPDAVQPFGAGHVVETNLDFGIGLAEHFHMSRQNIEDGGPPGRDVDDTLINLEAALIELFVQMFELLDEGHGHLKEELAVVRELDAGAAADEECDR